jgi:hypothetical protein
VREEGAGERALVAAGAPVEDGARVADRKGKSGRGLEERLEAVRASRGQADTPELRALLARALADRSNLIVAEAAEVIADGELADLAPALGEAFARLMVDPIASDKTCRGKTAIASALTRMGADTRQVFLAGISHRQLEPAWGAPVDTAGELRGRCALGLVRARHPDAAALVAERLADPEHVTRAAVAQILVELDQAVAVPLLRFKIAAGDQEPSVIAACFASLLELEPGAAVPLAAAYLETHPGGFAEAVALALGESRRHEAFPILRDWSERGQDERRVGYVALALMRDDQAFDHLVAVVAEESRPAAEDALAALGPFRQQAALVARVMAALRTRGDQALLAIAGERFRAG